MTSILVVGGGPAGLAAALLAAEAGHKVCLVEAADRFGGMSASIEVAGQRVDLGSHRLHPSASPAVRALLDRLLGADLQTRFRNGRIGLGGSLLGFPLSPLDLARNLPPRFAAAAVADQLTSPLRRPKADTYAEVVRAGLGPAMLDWFYGPYAHKLWGCPPEALAGEIARRRISVNGVKGVVGKILRPQRTFLYPRLGYGQVIDRLVDAAQEAGVDLRSSSAIEALDIADTHIEADLRGSSSEVFDRVWWTAPMGRLAEVVEGGPDASVLRHRAMLLVYLVLDQPRFTPYDAHYFPDPDVLPARLSEPKNYRDGPDPGDRTVLCAEVAVEGGDRLWRLSPEELAAEVVTSLGSTGLPAIDPIEVAVERLRHVYPVVRPGETESRSALASWAHSHDRIQVFGRQGLVVADNLHHVLDMAIEAAGCLASDGAFDNNRWLGALDRFESHVVED